ncbi:hypothetical protein GCM10025867_47990 (plasmid) [Frondihabitans sucicola]|uniref:Uncharacterized protein n=1 Tax=Frondihabitans sucicola TaxID=1268041 RepID=A0ABN6Y5V0_9MICO|nr:hypothetical protein [Frondihabitans sucicola]BDZ52558.1 hypothetical protein GCM10025867_47990 [Frondihabitans sucicola]
MNDDPTWTVSDQAQYDSDDLIDRLRRASASLTALAMDRDGSEAERLLGKRDGVDAALLVAINAPDWATAYFDLSRLVEEAPPREAEGWQLARGYAVEYFRNRPISVI